MNSWEQNPIESSVEDLLTNFSAITSFLIPRRSPILAKQTEARRSMIIPRRCVLFCCIAVAHYLDSTAAFPQYATRIPNGQSVPNPEPQGGIWAGVGHLNAGGGGPLNPFGEAFAASGYEWIQTLCESDSDGDGRSNGEELGDPNCEWMEGDPDPDLPAVSHPGIVDEAFAEPPVLPCGDYVEPETIVEYDVKFSGPTSIDDTRTHYVCEQMEMSVPSQEVLHEVKSAVLLDNKDILHHMFVYFCPDGSVDGDKVGQGAYECSGNESRCNRVAGWAVGPEESCLPPNVGVEFNFTEMENMIVKLEAHYDNSLGVPQQDQSGIRITYTPELRPLKSQSSMLGVALVDNQFVIPPNEPSYSLTNICPSEATAQLSHPIYAYQFYPHMHYFGQSLFTEHYRCGRKIGELGRINAYEFDNQQAYLFDKPVKILPGDALVTTCTYNSLTSDKEIRGGEETLDEMCLNFIEFYPDTEPAGLLNPCISVLQGVNVTDNNGPAFSAAGQRQPNAQLLSRARFTLSGRGRETLLLQFGADPTESWAPCCEDDSCDVAFLAQESAACSLDVDCSAGLFCDGGICTPDDVEVEPPTTTENGAPDEEEESPPADTSSADMISVSGLVSLLLASLAPTLL